ncbi:MAG: TIGR00266 family protein [Euryarchaeota archaeon]|nr:TIGR00266 family protein [Euryarchaeota archaeon]
MKYSITGDNLQFANIEIAPGEVVFAEAGSMAYMTGNVSMDAKMRGGLFKGFKRKLTGESFFLTHFSVEGGSGIVAFAGRVPGKIMALDLRGGKQFILQKDSFLCAEDQIDFDIAFQKKLGAALFGGEGLILQRVWGEGTVFINGCGDFIEFSLEPGQLMKISTSHVVGWETSVEYDIQSVGGITTAFFGGEGLFVTTLRGPGRVIIQSLTLAKLANSLVPYLPTRGDQPLLRIG